MRRQTLWMLPVLIVLALGPMLLGALSWWERRELEQLEISLLTTGRALAQYASDKLGTGRLADLSSLARATQLATNSRVRILDEQRKVIVDSLEIEPERQAGLGFRPEIRSAFQGKYSGYTRLSDENPLSLALYVAVPIQSEGTTRGVAYISHSTDQILYQLGEIRRFLQRLLVVFALLALALSLYLSGRLQQTLRGLRGLAGKVAEPGADPNVDVIGRGIDKLVLSLQQKVAQLEEEKLKTRLFLEDVAHELKTPVTGLSGSVEALLSEQDQERRTRLLGTLERETKRLRDLITRLLEVQNLNYYQLRPVHFEVASLFETAFDSYEHEATKKNITLHLEGGDNVVAWGDADKILTLVNNLIDNAIRCAPQDSTVTGRVEVLPDRVRISVEDEGPGFDHSLLARRQREGRPAGLGSSGLGLAIASQIARLHGSELEVLPGEPRGARVVFELPQPTRGEAPPPP